MSNYTFQRLKHTYKPLIERMETHASRLDMTHNTVDRIQSGKSIYLDIQSKTNVPWYFIALCHLRESNLNFKKHLHNGDSLESRTVRVPPNRPLKGEGPFSFEESAIDALQMKNYHKVKKWTYERICYCLETYNGFGYRKYKVNSPYLWAGTNNYTIGKYVKDHVYDPDVIDRQLGCMSVLKTLTDRENIIIPYESDEDIAVEAPKAQIEPPSNKEMRQTSRKWRLKDMLEWLFGGSAITATGKKLLDTANLQETKTYLDTLNGFIDAYGFWIFITACVIGGLVVYKLKEYQKEDISEGRYEPSGENKDV